MHIQPEYMRRGQQVLSHLVAIDHPCRLSPPVSFARLWGFFLQPRHVCMYAKVKVYSDMRSTVHRVCCAVPVSLVLGLLHFAVPGGPECRLMSACMQTQPWLAGAASVHSMLWCVHVHMLCAHSGGLLCIVGAGSSTAHSCARCQVCCLDE